MRARNKNTDPNLLKTTRSDNTDPLPAYCAGSITRERRIVQQSGASHRTVSYSDGKTTDAKQQRAIRARVILRVRDLGAVSRLRSDLRPLTAGELAQLRQPDSLRNAALLFRRGVPANLEGLEQENWCRVESE